MNWSTNDKANSTWVSTLALVHNTAKKNNWQFENYQFVSAPGDDDVDDDGGGDAPGDNEVPHDVAVAMLITPGLLSAQIPATCAFF